MRFAILADTHIEAGPEALPRANRHARHAVAAITALEPCFVVHLDDVVHPVPEANGRAASLDTAAQILGTLPCPLLITPGNHDIGDKPSVGMPATTVERRRVEELVCDGPRTFLFTHYPPSGSSGSSAAA